MVTVRPKKPSLPGRFFHLLTYVQGGRLYPASQKKTPFPCAVLSAGKGVTVWADAYCLGSFGLCSEEFTACCLLSCCGGRRPFGCWLRELLGQEAQQWPVDHEEEADFHRIAEEVLDEAAQEDGRSCFVVEDGQPERVEAQMDEDHDEKEGDAGAP